MAHMNNNPGAKTTPRISHSRDSNIKHLKPIGTLLLTKILLTTKTKANKKILIIPKSTPIKVSLKECTTELSLTFFLFKTIIEEPQIQMIKPYIYII